MPPTSTDHQMTAILLLIALLVVYATYRDPALAEALGAAAAIVSTLYEVLRRDDQG